MLPCCAIPSGSAEAVAEGGNDIEHIHDQTLAAVVGMISGASLTEYSAERLTL
jgi:hypothetical protein